MEEGQSGELLYSVSGNRLNDAQKVHRPRGKDAPEEVTRCFPTQPLHNSTKTPFPLPSPSSSLPPKHAPDSPANKPHTCHIQFCSLVCLFCINNRKYLAMSAQLVGIPAACIKAVTCGGVGECERRGVDRGHCTRTTSASNMPAGLTVEGTQGEHQHSARHRAAKSNKKQNSRGRSAL